MELGLELVGEKEELCPRSPWVVRVAGALVARRWLLPLLLVLLPLYAFWDATCATACLPLENTCYWGSDLQGWIADPRNMTPLTKCAWAFGALSDVALVGVVPSLRRIVGSGTDSGALAALGAGTRTVATPSTTSGAAWRPGQPFGLANWTRLLTLAAVLVAAIGFTMHVYFALGKCLFTGTIGQLGEAVNLGLMKPLLIVWYLTLKMAAALVAHRVAALRRKVARCDIQAPEWESEVVLETQALINDTFPTLSQAWGPGAIALCVSMGAAALHNVCYGLRMTASASRMASCMVQATLYACAPLLVLWDLADAGSECDLLTKGLNEKRIANPSDEAHAKIYKLEVMLNQLNKKQGLGFVLGGVVLDKAYFFGLVTKLCGVAVTLIGSLLTLRHDEAAPTAASTCSSLTQAQEATLHLFQMLNTSCTYNITIGPAGLVVH
eukprot:COSAG01_NODE_5950_length_3939_cov_1.486719_2_plen_439_part_00